MTTTIVEAIDDAIGAIVVRQALYYSSSWKQQQQQEGSTLPDAAVVAAVDCNNANFIGGFSAALDLHYDAYSEAPWPSEDSL